MYLMTPPLPPSKCIPLTQDIVEGMKTPSKSILDVGVQNAMNKSGTGPGDPVFTLRFPYRIPLRGTVLELRVIVRNWAEFTGLAFARK